MRRIHRIFQTAIAVTLVASSLAFGLPLQTQADTANAPSLIISQLKITSSNGQFVTLYNATNNTLDMSKYQLEYFNNYDLSKSTSSRLIALSGMVPPHGYFMVSDSSLLLCYQLTVDSQSLGFSSTAGLVEVLAFNQSNPGSSVVPTMQDYVGWSKTAASGAQTLPVNTNAFLQRQPVNVQNNPAVSSAGSGSWLAVQPDPNNACNLVTITTIPSVIPTGLSQLLPATEPPATFVTVSTNDSGQAAASLPASDIGLIAPTITELLPNPTGTGNDDSDEFIELYNPNNVPFDLTGFGLQVGTTSLHNFSFAGGTKLPAKGFVAFYSSDTKLSLSNTGGQAKLLDPFGNSISASGVYASAKDGQAWALAKGKWYWTTEPTPGKANVIKQPPTTKKATKKSTAKTKGPSIIKKHATSSSTNSSSLSPDEASSTPIHFQILAIIGGLALLYGTYEYRADLANRIHQFKRYLTTRRADRQ